jgi:predicted nucleotidyltransferase
LSAGSLRLRKKTAREAASLLYSGVEKEYRQAKLEAAKIVKCNFLPTNLEIALELDKMAEENEAPARKERLIQMRKEALKLMRILKAYQPLLIGSVWRGTIRYSSDVDIVVIHDEPEDILEILRQNDLKIIKAEWVAVTKKGKRNCSFHIYVELPAKEKAEIKIVQSSEPFMKEKCQIYGDEITGLSVQKLEELLKENPTQRFVPSQTIDFYPNSKDV